MRIESKQRIINSKLKEILLNQTIPKSKKSNRAKESITELMLKMQSIKTLMIPLFSHFLGNQTEVGLTKI